MILPTHRESHIEPCCGWSVHEAVTNYGRRHIKSTNAGMEISPAFIAPNRQYKGEGATQSISCDLKCCVFENDVV